MRSGARVPIPAREHLLAVGFCLLLYAGPSAAAPFCLVEPQPTLPTCDATWSGFVYGTVSASATKPRIGDVVTVTATGLFPEPIFVWTQGEVCQPSGLQSIRVIVPGEILSVSPTSSADVPVTVGTNFVVVSGGPELNTADPAVGIRCAGPVATSALPVGTTVTVTFRVTSASPATAFATFSGQIGLVGWSDSARWYFNDTAVYPPRPEIVVASTGPGEYDFSAVVEDGEAPFTYEWSFDDGATGSGSPTEHVYTLPGEYDVSVLVTDVAGRTGSASAQLLVPAPSLTVEVETVDPDADFEPGTVTPVRVTVSANEDGVGALELSAPTLASIPADAASFGDVPSGTFELVAGEQRELIATVAPTRADGFAIEATVLGQDAAGAPVLASGRLEVGGVGELEWTYELTPDNPDIVPGRQFALIMTLTNVGGVRLTGLTFTPGQILVFTNQCRGAIVLPRIVGENDYDTSPVLEPGESRVYTVQAFLLDAGDFAWCYTIELDDPDGNPVSVSLEVEIDTRAYVVSIEADGRDTDVNPPARALTGFGDVDGSGPAGFGGVSFPNLFLGTSNVVYPPNFACARGCTNFLVAIEDAKSEDGRRLPGVTVDIDVNLVPPEAAVRGALRVCNLEWDPDASVLASACEDGPSLNVETAGEERGERAGTVGFRVELPALNAPATLSIEVTTSKNYDDFTYVQNDILELPLVPAAPGVATITIPDGELPYHELLAHIAAVLDIGGKILAPCDTIFGALEPHVAGLAPVPQQLAQAGLEFGPVADFRELCERLTSLSPEDADAEATRYLSTDASAMDALRLLQLLMLVSMSDRDLSGLFAGPPLAIDSGVLAAVREGNWAAVFSAVSGGDIEFTVRPGILEGPAAEELWAAIDQLARDTSAMRGLQAATPPATWNATLTLSIRDVSVLPAETRLLDQTMFIDEGMALEVSGRHVLGNFVRAPVELTEHYVAPVLFANIATVRRAPADLRARMSGLGTLTEPAPAGATELAVSLIGAFEPGDTAVLNGGGDTEELIEVSELGSLILVRPLLFDHEAGETVIEVSAVVEPPLVVSSAQVSLHPKRPNLAKAIELEGTVTLPSGPPVCGSVDWAVTLGATTWVIPAHAQVCADTSCIGFVREDRTHVELRLDGDRWQLSLCSEHGVPVTRPLFVALTFGAEGANAEVDYVVPGLRAPIDLRYATPRRTTLRLPGR